MSPLPGPDPATWNALALAAGNIFATHAWASCWWEEYGDGATPHVLVDDPRDPRVLLPLCTSGRLLRRTHIIGHGPADMLGPAGRPEDQHLAAALLHRALADRTIRTDVVLLQDVPVDAGWPAPLAGRQVRREASPVLDLTPYATWEDYLASRSRNFRSQVGRKTRKLEREHAVEHRLATAETLQADLDHLHDLHGRHWGVDSPFLEETHQRFTRAFAAAALAHGWLRLRTLHLDGRCAAAYLGFHLGPHEYYYQFGRDPELADSSVGLVLLCHAMRETFEEGSTEFRFLRGDEGYKARFTTEPADIATVAVPQTRRGRVATAVAARRDTGLVSGSDGASAAQAEDDVEHR